MTPFRVLFARVRAIVGARQRDREFDDEVASHLAEAADEFARQGLSNEEARRAARRSFGGVSQVTQVHREARSIMWVDDLRQDVRYTARTMVRHPVFALVVVLTLALGIGANTAIFTLLDAVVFRALPVPAAGELLVLYENGPEGKADRTGGTGRYLRFSYPRVQRLQQALGANGSLAAVTRSARFVARVPGAIEPHFLRAQLVSGGYFSTVRVPAARGRILAPADVDAAAPVAVVSDGYWRRRLGADENAVGRTIVVNGVSVTVAGVTPPGFSGIWADADADIWLPLTLQPALHYENNSSGYADLDPDAPWPAQDAIAWLNVVARVDPKMVPQVTPALQTANQQGVAALAGLIEDADSRTHMLAHTLTVEPFSRGFSGLRARFADALFALGGMVVLVLLITAANIANLFLARAAGRTRDVGIRMSLGAGTGRLVRQSLTESVILALIGGAAGVVLGSWISNVLARQVLGTSGQLPSLFARDPRILPCALGVSVLVGIVFGLAPAFRAIAMGRRSGFAANQREAVGQAAMPGMPSLVVGQLALAVVVVFAAVLLGRTLVNFTRVDPGFDAAGLVSASFDPIVSGYPANQMPQLARRLIAAVRRVPGVTSAAMSRCGLVSTCSSSAGYAIDGVGTDVTLHDNWVSADYFATAGLRILSGRSFDDRDRERSPRVAIVNESAQRYFPDRRALGRRLGSSQPDTEVIGVIRDARTQTLRDEPIPMVYFPLDQRSVELQTAPTNMDIRVATDAASAVPAIRAAIKGAEPDLLLDDVAPMSARLERDLNRERLVAWLAFSFGVLALLLASIGLYGVLSYNVARRTQEIGVRMALGARRIVVMRSILGQSGRLTVTGLAIGLLGAAAGSQYLSGLLYGVTPTDPFVLAAVGTVFIVVTTVAAYVPARRATRVDPLVALRSE
jgi:putative ABC transport system permease protein